MTPSGRRVRRTGRSRSASPRFIALFGVVAIVGSLQVGIGWGAEGPHAGFFPFYVGLIIVARQCRQPRRSRAGPTRRRAVRRMGRSCARCCRVVVPTAVYVALIPFLGIYVSSATADRACS